MTHYAKHRVTDFLVPERHHTSKTNCVLIVNDNSCESPQAACRNQRNQNQRRATKIPGEPTMSLLWSVGIHCGYLSGDAANDRGQAWRGEDVQHGTAARSRRRLNLLDNVRVSRATVRNALPDRSHTSCWDCLDQP